MFSAPEVLEHAGKKNVVNQSYRRKTLDRDFDFYYQDDVKKNEREKRRKKRNLGRLGLLFDCLAMMSSE